VRVLSVDLSIYYLTSGPQLDGVSAEVVDMARTASVNKNAEWSGERMNGASFCHLWMGNLVVYIHHGAVLLPVILT
jgi:hypothetical protein